MNDEDAEVMVIEKLRELVEKAERDDADEHASGLTIIAIADLRAVLVEIERLRAHIAMLEQHIRDMDHTLPEFGT